MKKARSGCKVGSKEGGGILPPPLETYIKYDKIDKNNVNRFQVDLNIYGKGLDNGDEECDNPVSRA